MTNNSVLQDDLQYILDNIGGAEKFRGKKILVTGCAGFLGFYFSHFFAFASLMGCAPKSLVLLDNFILGQPDWIKRIAGQGNVQVHAFDISKDDISGIEEAAEADYVIHLASIASPTFYRKYPLQTIDANIWGLRNLLDHFRGSGIEGFLFFSSSEIYGDPLPEFIPTGEEYRGNVSCMGPRACYDEAKRFGETLCYVYANEHQMPLRIVRPFNNYGPGMRLDDKRVPADFAKAVLNGEDIVIHSDGMPTRTFCYVADAVVGYLKSLVHDSFDYFNIGIEKPEISVSKLADIYTAAGRELFGYKGNTVHRVSQDKNYLAHNPSRRCPDISKARAMLGYNPTISVESGIRRFLTFLEEERKVQ